jgi:hypothetical protein
MRTFDIEVAEELRDEPALLALADALVATRRSRRRRTTVAIALASAALVGFAALLIPLLGDRSTLVERALAAVGDGPIVHAVLFSDPSADPSGGGVERIALATGKRVPLVETAEVWYDRRSQTMRTVQRLNGERFNVVLTRPGEATTSYGTIPAEQSVGSPLFEVFVRDYREALAEGKAVEGGRGRIDGREVTWLVFPTRFRGQTTRVAVDRDGNPVAEQAMRNGKPLPGGAFVRVRSIESISAAPGLDAPVPFTDPHVEPVASRETSLAEASAELGRALLTPGGLELRRVTVSEIRVSYADGRPRTSKEALLEYTNANEGVLTIRESRDEASLRWRGIAPPAGTTDVFQTSARLQIEGTYITIEAPSRELAVRTARALAQR